MKSRDDRKRTQSVRNFSSLTLMANEDSDYQNNAVVSKSKAALFKEMTCMVMQSSNYIKTLPEVDFDQLNKKKVSFTESEQESHNSGKKGTILSNSRL